MTWDHRLSTQALDDLWITEIKARRRLKSALELATILTEYGLDVFGSRTSLVNKRGESREDHAARVAKGREQINIREFAMAYTYCVEIEKTKSFNRHHSSYGLKNLPARYYGSYLTNGAFIAGTIAAGFAFKPIGDTPNVLFNMSERSLKMLDIRDRAKQAHAFLEQQ
jgi:hypothetical protein